MCEKAPLISVIIPSKNRPVFILKAIESVLAQTYKNVEIIVVDDGSEVPLTSVLAKSIGLRVQCLRHGCSKGAPMARNTGIKHAKGEYIAFLDDDDIWLPEKLERQLLVFQSAGEDTGLVYCGFTYIHNDSDVAECGCEDRGHVFNRLLLKNFVGSASLPLIRMECFKSSGAFDENFQSFQDWDMWLRIAQNYLIDFIDESLVLRTMHGEQITSDLKAKISGREQYIRKYYDDLATNKKTLSHQYRILSDNYFLSKKTGKGAFYCYKAFISSPFNWINYLNMVLIFIPEPIRSHLIFKKSVYSVGDIHFFG